MARPLKFDRDLVCAIKHVFPKIKAREVIEYLELDVSNDRICKAWEQKLTYDKEKVLEFVEKYKENAE